MCKKGNSLLSLEGDGGTIPKTRSIPRQAQGWRAGREEKEQGEKGIGIPSNTEQDPSFKKIKHNTHKPDCFLDCNGKDHETFSPAISVTQPSKSLIKWLRPSQHLEKGLVRKVHLNFT